MWIRPPLVAIAIGSMVLALGLIPSRAHAQFLSHNYKGDFGLLAGSQPPPGWLAAAGYVHYNSDTFRDKNGDPLDIGGKVTANGYALGAWYVSNLEIFGATYGAMAFPAWTDNNLEVPALGFEQETSVGFTDLFMQPINLGWHGKQADTQASFGIVAPTGSYDPDALDNAGLGMWSFEPSVATTYWFDSAKKWHISGAGFYEFHTKKKDTDIRVGDILTLEGGTGRSWLEGLASLGITGYAQFKVTEDDVGDLQPVFDMLQLGKHRVFGLGAQGTLPIATKERVYGVLSAQYQWEFGARSALEGGSLIIVAAFFLPSVAIP
jgi:hypothetical protein